MDPENKGTQPPGSAEGETPEKQAQAQDAGQEGGETPDFDGWLNGQDEGVRLLVTGHIAKLQTALDRERDERKGLARQIRDLAKGDGDAAALKQQVEELSAAMEAATKRSSFYESAPGDLSNPKLAYLAATEAGLIAKSGQVNWEELRKQAPELFRAKQTPPRGDSGSGTQSGPPRTTDMNSLLRQAAGRG